MNILDSLFSWFTVATLRGSLLALAVLALQAALRGRLPARWRYALWLPMVFVLGAPMLPQSRWSLENRFIHEAPQMESNVAANRPIDVIPGLELLPLSPATAAPAPGFPWRRVLGAGWLAGAAGMLGLAWIGYIRALRRIRHGGVATPAALAAMLTELAPARAPRLLVSRAVECPAVTGFLRPTLLVPADFADTFTPAEARLVLRHELTHLARLDLPANWLLCLLQALHWCNPLLWFAFARMRADREAACDAQVLAADASDCRADYGHALLKLEGAGAHPGLSLGFIGLFERAAGVRARIRAIAAHRPAKPAWSLLGIALIAALTLVGATRAQEKPAAESVAASEEILRARLTKKMNDIVIPRLEFREATISDALDFLHRKSIELDADEPDPAQRGVRFVMSPEVPAADEARITLSLTRIPLIEATRYVTSLANLKFKVGTDAVAIVPTTASDELILRNWKVTPELLSVLGFKRGGDVKEFLQTAGVSFPKGSAAALVDDESRLVMRNTQENLDLTDKLIEAAVKPKKPTDDAKTEAAPDSRERIIAKAKSIVPLPADTKVLFTREFRVLPAAAAKLGLAKGADEPSAVDVLKRAGVEFPPGSAATYLRAGGRLFMRNTPENQDRLDELMNNASATSPAK